MLTEEIKTEIAKQVKGQIQSSSIEKIILNSQYHCLTFSGLATNINSVMTARYDPEILRNKNLLIKSFKTFAYANDPTIDIEFSDGTIETLPNNHRINRPLDLYSNSLQLRVFINGALTNLFSEDVLGGTYFYPMDLNIDNIYYLYKDKVNDVAINANCHIDIDFNGGDAECLLVVMMECYTF